VAHVAPETPGSIHEGGELGYSLSHAYGAVFDNPDLMVACIVGDGEAETGPLATSWHSNKFLDPVHDGAVIPILHLNGYKIANPAVLDRIGDEELESLMVGYGYRPYLVEGSDPGDVHRQLAATLDAVVAEIHDIQTAAREHGETRRPSWPMVVLRTPKGWTGPAYVDGVQMEGTWRTHQVPLSEVRENPGHLAALESWLQSYRPAELFDENGRPVPELTSWLPKGDARLGANLHANGGTLRRPLDLPKLDRYGVSVDKPGGVSAEATRVLGGYLRDVMQASKDTRNFRIFGPDETASNRLASVYDVTDKAWSAELRAVDEHLARGGRVMEMLSEHTCQGWLEGYLLTGRHGLLSSYEAFAHIVDSMFNQHAKWLKVARHLDWRRDIASLNYLLTSHVWR
jgi:xylulose-5-phosphate/fructose-6-phosphate phosphoketolase